MTGPGAALASAASGLVGARFRLGGRDPATGLDCIGLVVAALEMVGRPVAVLPAYTLRQHDLHRLLDIAPGAGLQPAPGGEARGDVLLLRPSPSQWHLAISLGSAGIVHAHAELRRVVITPPPLPWPVMRRWRLA